MHRQWSAFRAARQPVRPIRRGSLSHHGITTLLLALQGRGSATGSLSRGSTGRRIQLQ